MNLNRFKPTWEYIGKKWWLRIPAIIVFIATVPFWIFGAIFLWSIIAVIAGAMETYEGAEKILWPDKEKAETGDHLGD